MNNASFAVADIFTPIAMVHPTMGEQIADSAEKEVSLKVLGFAPKDVPTRPVDNDFPTGQPLPTNLTKDQRKKIRAKNSAGSMRIPDQFHTDGLVKEGKIIAFPAKRSRRTGDVYAACQLEIDGVRFCTLDNDPEKFDVGMSVKVTFKKSTNPEIQSGFECTYSL